ncbi:transcriptional regulatory protein [Paramyrothecium foliicola]|nr:transcriptional regulatory protein [Paramyrothecium foliicola]
MNTSDFGDFAFPFQTLSDHESITQLPDEFDTGITHAFNQQAPVSSAMTSGPHSVSAVSLNGVAFAHDPDHPAATSMEGSDNGVTDERSSPLANSFDDGGADEFGLSTQGRADGTDLGGKAKDDKSDAPPAWSELKTKAGKERKRLPLACIACRRKKIRCSGEKPACKHCLRSRIPCVYKVTTRKAAPRTDYMSMLDKRLKRMEERIIKIIPKSEQDTTSSITRAVVKPAIPGSLPTTKSTSKKRGADEAFGADLEAWARGSTKTPLTDEDRATSLQVQEAEEDALFREGLDALPSKEIQEHLAEVFFDNIYGQAYHLLHKPSYMRKLESNSLPPVLVLSVCAVAARFTGNPRLNSSTKQFLRGEEWASLARDICTRRYEWPNITVLTCLLLLGLHEFGTCQGGRSWALGGQAIRMAFALQLHKDLEYDPLCRKGKKQLSFIDREIRRRIMWACFLMDRFNSSGTDRPMFIKEEAVDIPLPVKERYFQLDMPAFTETLSGKLPQAASFEDGHLTSAKENMGVAAYMIRSIALWGRIITYLNQGGRELDDYPLWDENSGYSKLTKDADELFTAIPDCLQYSSDNLALHITEKTSSQYLFLHMSMQQNVLFLNRMAAASSNGGMGDQPPNGFISEASSSTVAAANRISDILKDSEDSQCSVTAPFAGYCAFSSATVHILGIFSGDPALKTTAEANAGVNIRFLRRMMKHWGMFHWMVEDIRVQYRNALDAARSGTSGLPKASSSPILQYGDWFSRYPHGVTDSEFMDPASIKKKEKGADGVLEQKPEMKSVEEFFQTLSPPHSTGSGDGSRGSILHRRSTSKRQSSTAVARQAQQQLDPLNTDASVGSAPDQLRGDRRLHRRVSGTMGTQLNGQAAFHSRVMPHGQNPTFNSLSPVSPVVNQLSHNNQAQQNYYSPDVLSMNLGLAQQPNGIMQPFNRQMMYNGYPMELGGLEVGHHMVDSLGDWDGLSGHPDAARRSHVRRDVKGVLDARHFQGQGGLAVGPLHDVSSQEASSAWLMPFNIDPPDISQEASFGGGNRDSFPGMFGGGSGMTTPNPLTGLRHGL